MSGCGCDGGGCGRRREEMTINPALLQTALQNLFTVAATGVKNFVWPSDDVAKLADLLASLLAENTRLKNLLGLRDPAEPQAVVDGDRVLLKLGPGGRYTLDIPAGAPEQRKALARDLATAAETLRRVPVMKSTLPGQLPLPFHE